MSHFAYRDDSAVRGKCKGIGKREFEDFFRLLYAELCNFTFTYTQSRSVAEDIVQSAFIGIWEQKEIWNEDDNIKAYLYKSVRNEALNYLKHRKVKRDAQMEIRLRIQEWKEDSLASDEEIRIKEVIDKGVGQLPGRRREIYLLSRESGLTYDEIADVLGISVKTVETQMGRALKSLRIFVSKHLGLPALIFLSILLFA